MGYNSKELKAFPLEKKVSKPKDVIYYPGFSDIFVEEMRRGGTLGPRSRTPKNIQSSINELMLRNYQLFGYLGKNIYDPDSKKQGRNIASF